MDDTDYQHEEPVNKTPEVINSALYTVLLFVQTYGWFIVLFAALLYFLKKKYQPAIDKWIEKRNYEQEVRTYDRDAAESRFASMDEARRRMQEQYTAQAERFAEEQKKKDELKRKEKVDDWERHEQGLGYRNRAVKRDDSESSGNPSGLKPKSKNVYRSQDYNPLTGSGGGGGSGSWRPSPRGGGAAGGG